ncbi:hypothetical protein [Mesorhizobium sp. A556]
MQSYSLPCPFIPKVGIKPPDLPSPRKGGKVKAADTPSRYRQFGVARSLGLTGGLSSDQGGIDGKCSPEDSSVDISEASEPSQSLGECPSWVLTAIERAERPDIHVSDAEERKLSW